MDLIKGVTNEGESSNPTVYNDVSGIFHLGSVVRYHVEIPWGDQV
jgi:hypothetical protein